jgi:ectoine hydroxylase-related dioxygenase (phytanoyl-CoA dioxygenase family)
MWSGAESLHVAFAGRPFDQAVNEASALYDEHGCFVAKGLLSPADIEPTQQHIWSLVDALYERAGLARPGGRNGEGSFDDGVIELARTHRKLVSHLYDAGRRLLPVHQLSVDRRLVDLARALIGTDVLAASDINAMRIDLPREDKYLFDWHQDYPYVLDSLDGVVFWIPLQDVDEINGCLTLAPGSHKLGLQKMVLVDPDNRQKTRQKSMRIAGSDAIDRLPQVRVPARVGDVLVFSTLLLHASGPNKSSRARFTLQIRFGNFLHPVAVRNGWPAAMRDGAVFHDLHPDYVAQSGTG